MPQNTRMTGRRWVECDRTGFEFPRNECSRERGFLVANRYLDRPGREETNDPRLEETEPEFADDALWFKDM